MDKNDVYKSIQRIIADCPLLLVGSGAYVSYGIPGMDELGQHLLTKLGPKFSENKKWEKFESQLLENNGLEQALTGIDFENDILDEIKCETWKLISEKDLDLFHRYVIQHYYFPMAELLSFLFEAAPQNVDVITTNYDRIIEYACDQAELPVSLGFNGIYLKHFSGEFSNKKSVNILKVHGSLDTFRDKDRVSVSIPLLQEIVPGLIPEIIAPGDAKYKEILQGTQRDLLSEADKKIKKASAFLCIGYGFNDSQIQENFVRRMQNGVPIIVLTKKLTNSGKLLLDQSAKRYICIEEGPEPNSTKITVNRETITFEDEMLWTIDGFMSIIK